MFVEVCTRLELGEKGLAGLSDHHSRRAIVPRVGIKAHLPVVEQLLKER